MSNTKEEKGVKIETKLKQLFKCRCAATIAVCQLFVVHSMCKVEIQKPAHLFKMFFYKGKQYFFLYLKRIFSYMQGITNKE